MLQKTRNLFLPSFSIFLISAFLQAKPSKSFCSNLLTTKDGDGSSRFYPIKNLEYLQKIPLDTTGLPEMPELLKKLISSPVFAQAIRRYIAFNPAIGDLSTRASPPTSLNELFHSLVSTNHEVALERLIYLFRNAFAWSDGLFPSRTTLDILEQAGQGKYPLEKLIEEGDLTPHLQRQLFLAFCWMLPPEWKSLATLRQARITSPVGTSTNDHLILLSIPHEGGRQEYLIDPAYGVLKRITEGHLLDDPNQKLTFEEPFLPERKDVKPLTIKYDISNKYTVNIHPADELKTIRDDWTNNYNQHLDRGKEVLEKWVQSNYSIAKTRHSYKKENTRFHLFISDQNVFEISSGVLTTDYFIWQKIFHIDINGKNVLSTDLVPQVFSNNLAVAYYQDAKPLLKEAISSLKKNYLLTPMEESFFRSYLFCILTMATHPERKYKIVLGSVSDSVTGAKAGPLWWIETGAELFDPMTGIYISEKDAVTYNTPDQRVVVAYTIPKFKPTMGPADMPGSSPSFIFEKHQNPYQENPFFWNLKGKKLPLERIKFLPGSTSNGFAKGLMSHTVKLKQQ